MQIRKLLAVSSHWGWAVPILLLVTLLAIPEISLNPPSRDEFFSMQKAGWLFGGPYSPAAVLENIDKYAPDHMPGYFILLSLWGDLTAWQVELGRILSIFFGMMSLAVTYRLGRDFVAPAAGLIALILVSSAAFYNFYFPYVRMYTLLPFIAGVILWTYLRVLYKQKQVKSTDYVFLGIAAFTLINIHALAAIFLLMLGIYHLLIAPKNLRWLLVSVAVCAGVLLATPYLLQKASAVQVVSDVRAVKHVGALSAVFAWFNIVSNGQVALLLIPLVGLIVAVRNKTVRLNPWWALALIYLLLIAATAELTTWVTEGTMRYHLAAWPPFVLAIVAGLYALYQVKRWISLSLILWIVAGVAFQASNDLATYVFIPGLSTMMPPTQVISRLAIQAEMKPAIVGYNVSEFYRGLLVYDGRQYWDQYIDYSQTDHYFERHNIAIQVHNDIPMLEDHLRRLAVSKPSLWAFYQKSNSNAENNSQVEAIIQTLNYERCGRVAVGKDTVIDQYMWNMLDCQPARVSLQQGTELIDYRLYSAALDEAGSKLYLVDQWTAVEDFDATDYSLSYQLLTANWDNVAQLDLPLDNGDQLRMHYIDVAHVEPGVYRLMLILYNARTGERQVWRDNLAGVPEILKLSDFDLR